MNKFAQVNSAGGIPGLESCLFSVQGYMSYVCFSRCISHILSGWCEQAAPGHINHSNSHCYLQGTLALRKTPNYWQEEEGSWAGRVLKSIGEDHQVFNFFQPLRVQGYIKVRAGSGGWLSTEQFLTQKGHVILGTRRAMDWLRGDLLD